MTQVVLVDKQDNEIGLVEKFKAHHIPVPLHRAISIVIFNNDKTKMLITKRASSKPTWPSFWTNAVCSHPYPEETYQAAADRRLYEELGFKIPIRQAFKFTYQAEMDNGIWGEHEYDVTFVGTYEGMIHPNPEEIDGYEWNNISDLKRDIKVNPEKYTPWFKIILKKVYTHA